MDAILAVLLGTVRTVTALSSKKELGLPVGEPPVKLMPKMRQQVPRFHGVPSSTSADMRTRSTLSSKKELLKQHLQQDQVVAVQPGSRGRARLARYALVGTSLRLRGHMSSLFLGWMLVMQELFQL